jgi:flagellar hook assembly protein FlgD
VYEYGGFYEVTSDEPLRWDVHTTYSEQSSTVGVVDGAGRPAILRAFPNPFRTGTSFQLDLAAPGRARVDVFDATGRHVTSLLDATLSAGPVTVRWDGTGSRGESVGAGVYYVRFDDAGPPTIRSVVRR